MIFFSWEFKITSNIIKESDYTKMVKLLISQYSHTVSSSKNGSTDHGAKSLYRVTLYTQTQSIAPVQNAFRARFPDRNPPTKRTVMKNIRKYSAEAGTSLNLNKSNSGRRRTTRSEENIAAVRDLLQQNPGNVSVRRNPLPISRTGFNRITRLDLRITLAPVPNACATRVVVDTSCSRPST